MGPDHTWVRDAGDRFALHYVDGSAAISGVAAEAIAQAVGTPAYVYSLDHIEQRYRALEESVSGRPTSLCYAVKANSSQAVLRHLASLGAGADIVSGGELARALAAGIDPAKIVYSGVGKTDAEIDAALEAKIRSINVESDFEIEQVAARAKAAGDEPAPISLRLNPDVDPKTHPYLATGMQEAKFGIAMTRAQELCESVIANPHLRLVGLAFHIGSQIVDSKPFLDSVDRVRDLLAHLLERGVRLHHLDIGGGVGIAYEQAEAQLDVGAWGEAVVAATRDLDVELLLEPGRYLVGQAGVLLTRVVGNKRGEKRSFVIVDAAMNDLIRPALYQAYHAIVPTRLPASDDATLVDIVGPVCESGDFLAQKRALSPVGPSDLLAVLSAGAYGMVMASNYNTRPMPPEVVVRGGKWAVTRPRQSVEDLLALEQEADWS